MNRGKDDRSPTEQTHKRIPKMTINEKQDEIIEDFIQFDDWMDRYQMLIDLGGDAGNLREGEKNEKTLIDGCQSRVWLVCSKEDGVLRFRADSDALIVKGLVQLLINIVDGQTAEDILDADFYFIEKIGLADHLSPTRSNGLLAMVKQIKMYALVESRRG